MLPSNRRFSSCSSFLAAVVFLGAVLSTGAAAGATSSKLKFNAVADFTRCIDRYEADPEGCLDALRTLVKSRPADTFAAGKVVRAKMNHAVAVPFFARALAAPGASGAKRSGAKEAKDERCADPDVAMAVSAGLELPAAGGPIVADALQILLERCWSELQAPVLKALGESGSSGYLAENLCPKLAERKVSSPSCEKKPAPAAPAAWKWKEVDPKAVAADGPAKVFHGREGASLTMVKLKGDDAYLLRFAGFRGAWNGRTVLHREVPTGSGYDYETQVQGGRWVGVVVRDGVTEVYPVGDKGPFGVYYDEVASKGTSADSVVEQFRKQK